MMKLRELESFNAFMLHRSVTKAAETVNISQPMVSRLLKNLEKSVGFSLFNRQGEPADTNARSATVSRDGFAVS